MIKSVTLCICDICGEFAEAARRHGGYNEFEYDAPKDWGRSAVNKDVHMCPRCQALVRKGNGNGSNET